MIKEDKFIEMLVAGLNRLAIPDAVVENDVLIGGRQFDVIATANLGVHCVMIAYEVKNKTRRISVDQIDAFVTKARDANANKLVFVSTSGYQ